MGTPGSKFFALQDWVTAPILGGSRAEHFSCMYNLLETKVDDEDMRRIDEISKLFIYAPFENQAIVGGAAPQKNWW